MVSSWQVRIEGGESCTRLVPQAECGSERTPTTPPTRRRTDVRTQPSSVDRRSATSATAGSLAQSKGLRRRFCGCRKRTNDDPPSAALLAAGPLRRVMGRILRLLHLDLVRRWRGGDALGPGRLRPQLWGSAVLLRG